MLGFEDCKIETYHNSDKLALDEAIYVTVIIMNKPCEDLYTKWRPIINTRSKSIFYIFPML